MRQIAITQYEKVTNQDVNNFQFAAAKAWQDDFAYNFFGQSAGGVMGSSFIASYVSALAASLAAGAGFFYDSAQTGFNPLFRNIISVNPIAVALTANTDPTNDRIDLICLCPNFTVTSTASRFVKTGGVGPIVSTVVNKTYADGYTLQVVAGTPAGSPTVPATPSGYIAIAKVLNRHASAGMSGSGAITDLRNIFSLSVSNDGHIIATNTTIQGQLDQLDAAAKLGEQVATRTVTTNQSMLATDGVVRSNSTSGNLTHTLPAVASTPTGKIIIIKDVGTVGYTTVSTSSWDAPSFIQARRVR